MKTTKDKLVLRPRRNSLRRTRLFYIAVFVWVLLWIIGGYTIVRAATFAQATDNSNVSTNTSWNRGFACSSASGLCYAFGGGTTSTGVDNVYSYDILTDTWSSSPQDLPATGAWLFFQYAHGGGNGYIVGTKVDDETTYVYNEAANTWSTVSPPSGFSGLFGFVGVTDNERYYYLFETHVDNTLEIYRLDMQNPGSGWTADTAIYTGSLILQWAKGTFDPRTDTIIIHTRDNGITIGYNILTGQMVSNSLGATGLGIFPPCDLTSICVPSVFYYDADLGLIAGKQGDPSSTSMTMYRFVGGQGISSTDAWVDSGLILSEADFNYLAFTSFAPTEGYFTDANGITNLVFGGGRTNLANPGVAASEWFYRIGDPGGVTTTENTFDTWLVNFFASMGMDSPVGRILVGSLFIMAIFMVMAIKGVPWIISLGLTGISAVMLTLVNVLDEAILLSLIAIVMFGGMGLIFALFMGGDRGDG